MANWREVKRQKLSPVHSTFAIPAVYLTHAAGTPQPVTVREHPRQIDIVGDGSDWSNAGQRVETEDTLVFSLSELPGRKVHPRAYVIFSDSEAYLTGASRPPRGNFVSVECSAVPQEELTRVLSETDTTLDAWRVIAPCSQQ